MVIKKIPYNLQYPSAAKYLIEQGWSSPPKQFLKELNWAWGIDIVYNLKNMTPKEFKRLSDTLLLVAYQESMRYNEYRYKFAGFDVKLGRLQKGRDLPDIVTFSAAMHTDAEVMIYGEKALGYELPPQAKTKPFLINKVDDILDILQRYEEKVSNQRPFKVVRLFISIRDPFPKEKGVIIKPSSLKE